ncbi:hypothetical protein [Ramlibacter sp.]|uniref:hypothetical protein n=1 Tax=Ramlibacter sp. TaxID=1917967 RepID=UPI002D737A02|nr:hypothetical protein [Ramlibacter sp.]HYD76445.1 hypothetical protein [Ramlibacter sp.]
MSAPTDHLPVDALLQDWLGESDAATREAVDTHLMACDACGERLDQLVALGAGVRGAVRAGRVTVVAGAGFVDRLAARGVRIREYRVPHNGGVNCTVAPDDEVLVSRLQAPLQGVQRLDLAVELSIQPGVVHRLDDIPFDPARGEVLVLPSVAQVRQLPAHTQHLTLIAREGDGSRELGRYEFRHSPWSS